jgi:ribonuclease HII
VLGLDEAGRGSVLGPLVLGGFLCPERSVAELVPLGVRDSKLLSPARRAELYEALGQVGRRYTVTLRPQEIDAAVAHRGLNGLEADGFARLVRRARPDRIEVDACDVRAERFGRRVAELARFDGPVVSRHRADRELPVVGAASIVAKVRRDAAVRRLSGQLGLDLGSGYPSDPRTVDHLRGILARPGVGPPYLRRSWATVERVKRELPRSTLDRFVA